MKRALSSSILALTLCLSQLPSSFAATVSEQEGIESLLFEEITTVVTASKKAEPINKAPSVVYVITNDEIKRSGARSLAEILKRVPGMRISVRESSLLGTRGFMSDQNDKFVFLIDGVPATNIMQDGAWGFIDMPNLEMVDHIEVVKGPGSTLWGSDASLGVVNIFTKTGEQIGGTRPSVSFTTRDEQLTGNVMIGNKTDKMDYLLSFTYANSKGYGTGENYNYAYNWGSNDVPNQNYISDRLSPKANPLLDFQPSWELYSKVKVGEYTFKTRGSYERMGYLWGTDLETAHQDIVFKHFYTDIEKEIELSADTVFTTKANFHTLSYDRGVLTQSIDALRTRDLETKSEMGLSLEGILSTTIDKHSIIAGAKAQSVQFGPSTRQQYMTGTTSTTLNASYAYVYVTDAGLDNTSGLYVEDSYSATDSLTLVAGLSYEYNDYRETTGQFMPRAAAIYEVNKQLSAKYTYNTGYQRPPIDKKYHKMFGHVEKSEKIEEHDAQVTYNTDKTRLSLTGFYYLIFDYFTWVDRTLTDGYQGHANQGDGKSDGVEFALRHNITDTLSLYGNFMYANTKINNGTPIGEPSQVYNVGTDYYLNKNLSFNVNVNGFANMTNGFPNEGYWAGDSEQLIDAAIVADNLTGRPLTLTLFVKNALDNNVHVGMTGWPGYTYAERASYGVKLAYKL